MVRSYNYKRKLYINTINMYLYLATVNYVKQGL